MITRQTRLWTLLVMCSLSTMVGATSFVKLQPERLPDMTIPRFCHSTFIINGELTVVGGHTSGFVLTKTAEYFKDGQWHLLQTVYNHDDGVCVPLRSGKVLLAGGYQENLGIGQTYEAEMYDPATHTFKGFGCLDKKRAHASGIEIDSGHVVISGNWYYPDGIELYEGKSQFAHIKETSVHRSMPYLLRTSDDVMVVSGLWDNYGQPITSNVVDRLKGEPFRVPLFETWHPILIGVAPRPDASLIGDIEKGFYAYLLPVCDSTGQVAICEVRDTVFSLLPTASPVPVDSEWGKIGWYTPIVVDRQAQRGYMLGQGEGDNAHKFLLSVDYTKTPAELTVYYTDPIPGYGASVPLVMPDGNLVITGGIGKDSTFFSPTASVWVLPVAGPSAPLEESWLEKLSNHWLWIVLAGLLLTAILAYLMIRRARKSSVNEQTEPSPVSHDAITDSLMQRIETLMEEQRLYLNNDLKMGDVAAKLGVHQNEVSACINSCKGYSFSQFVNIYRVVYAQLQLREHPDKKMSQVGLESGFANDTTFYRVFKTITGLTPSEWLSSVSES